MHQSRVLFTGHVHCRTDTFGIYVVMFIETLKTLVRVLGLFLTLLMGFAFSFHILLTVFLADNDTDVRPPPTSSSCFRLQYSTTRTCMHVC